MKSNKSPKTWKVKLSPNLVGNLVQEYNKASGGFQGHARQILGAMDADVLTIDDELIGKTWRYAYCYGKGGWQNVCKRILAAIEIGL